MQRELREIKKVMFTDRYNRILKVAPKVYEKFLRHGAVKYFIKVVYEYSNKQLNRLVTYLGLTRFMQLAGRMRYGLEGYKLATIIAKGI